MQTKEKKDSLWKSFGHALAGVWACLKAERNFRIHICMMLYVIVFSVIGKVGMSTFLMFLICFGAVFSAELVNSAIERLCDEVTREYSENIKKIKDISAGAVFVMAFFSAALGLCVFLSKEVLFAIGETFCRFPIAAVLVFASLPFAVWFIIGRVKND